ncbi:hypothetical protein ASPFODRAFT_248329 [Aspergillus luchuensis CBS 106.47]|uniref:Uncharacterized protein n=1 Tax=Aspergillus luchuensis (strain CBS 106.47) TaxID=1137211 RepID=A0A1M3TZC6_ASPLC|nr:hypothetical protein ASPFODRAFT_248329 [Aspergillus luchuensis CBS 106.47]
MAACRTYSFSPHFTDQKEYRPNRTSSPPLRRSQGSWWMMAPRRTSTTTEGLFGYDTDTHTHIQLALFILHSTRCHWAFWINQSSEEAYSSAGHRLRCRVSCLPFGDSPFSLCGNSPWKGNRDYHNSNSNPKQRSGTVFVGADRKAHLTQPAPEAKHSAGV